jgi:galactokinase
VKETVRKAFAEVFGEAEDVRVYFAPGRVNLIGEHTDYNGGHVFPCAISFGTYAAAAKRNDRKLRFYSVNFKNNGVVERSIDDFRPLNDKSWTSYPKGVMWAFAERGMKMDCGLDIVIGGDIPAGAGLSSSAALEVLTGVMLRDMYGFDVSNQDIALLGQKAENDYCGLNCGIMDQFASAMGKKDHAIFLDTSDLAFQYVPFVLKDEVLIITNTNKKHSLTESAYNDRRRECGEALAALQTVVNTEALCALEPEEFEAHKDAIKDPVCLRRAKHAVYENHRAVDGVKALENGELEVFGRLMNASHVSLRDDYEVSCEELDVLAETAWTIPGVIGSRMTGGGFGGCTVSIVKKESADEFCRIVGETYREKIGYDCTFYVVSPGGGPEVF